MILALARFELVLQVRHRVVAANAVSTLFIAVFAALVPPDARTPALASAFVFADPALLGLSFVGAVVHLERSARLDRALGVSPLPATTYVAAKALTLTGAGTLSGLVVAEAARGASIDRPLLLAALVLSNLFAALLGLVLAAGTRSMNQLLVRLLLASLVLDLPLLPHFGVAPPALAAVLALVPSTPMLTLLAASMGEARAPGQLVLEALALLGFIAVAAVLAVRAAERRILGREPPPRGGSRHA